MKSFIILILVLMLMSVSIISWILIDGNERTIEQMSKDAEAEKIPIEKIVIKKVYIEKEVYWYQFYATGYSPDDPSQGTNRTTANGNGVYQGAIAVDSKVIPLGTKVEIKGLPNDWDGEYTAEDIGGKIKGLRIDVFRENKFEALQINCSVWIRFLE